MDTLAAQLTVPPVGSVGDFHSLIRAPWRRTKQEAAGHATCRLSFSNLMVSRGGLEPATR